MSTYWYFECLDHTPPLRSQDEFTQHTEDAAWHAGVALANSRPLPNEYVQRGVDNYFEWNARQFLGQHPVCTLGLVDEYDRHQKLPKPGEKSDV